MIIVKDLKEDMNKSLNEVYENTMKMIQDIKVEIETLKKIQTDIMVEMKTLGGQTKSQK